MRVGGESSSVIVIVTEPPDAVAFVGVPIERITVSFPSYVVSPIELTVIEPVVDPALMEIDVPERE